MIDWEHWKERKEKGIREINKMEKII